MTSAAPNKNAAATAPKLSFGRLLLIIGLAAIIILAGIASYISSLLHSGAPSGVVVNGKASMSASLISQDILFYNSTQIVPYALLDINSRNISFITANAMFLRVPPPRRVYIVNSSNQCFNCGNVNQFIASLGQDLINYSVLNSTNRIMIISPSRIASGGVAPDSILIVPNGYLPSYMLENNTLNNLLSEGTSVIYIGQAFQKLIAPQDVLIPDINMPAYLNTTTGPTSSSSYIFNQSTFAFSSGKRLGPLSYVAVGNGTIIAFSNFRNRGRAHRAQRPMYRLQCSRNSGCHISHPALLTPLERPPTARPSVFCLTRHHWDMDQAPGFPACWAS